MFKRRSNRPEDDGQEGTPGRPLPGFLTQNELGAPPSAQPPTTDSGLGVPPFRPAPPKDKDPIDMARPPFAPNPTTVPNLPPAPPRPGMQPPISRPAPAGDPGERRALVVGRGISVQGTIIDAERLVVEGTVEATMIHATELSVIHGGVFKGEVEVEEAEIAGTIDGTITARTSLIVRATGQVLGRARCRRLQVEDGGQLTGQIEMLKGDAPAGSSAPAASTPAVGTPALASEFARPDVPASATYTA